jgi:hypothetical protein
MHCSRYHDMLCICYQQFTPLIVAALQGQMSAADALLDEGHADVKARNSRGTTCQEQQHIMLHSLASRLYIDTYVHYQYHTESDAAELLLFLPSTACCVAYYDQISYCCTTTARRAVDQLVTDC